jgi:hypothetical protein
MDFTEQEEGFIGFGLLSWIMVHENPLGFRLASSFFVLETVRATRRAHVRSPSTSRQPQQHAILVLESSHMASFRLIFAARTRKHECFMHNVIIAEPEMIIAVLLVSDLQVASSLTILQMPTGSHLDSNNLVISQVSGSSVQPHPITNGNSPGSIHSFSILVCFDAP